MASISLPKGYQRLGPFPLDDTFVFNTLESLETYAATNASAYSGQICVVSSTSDVYIIKDDKSLSYVANNQVITNHIADETLHLSSAQNTLLDGITVTSDKINYLSDVSSTIQEQLDGKSATDHGHANATTLVDGFLSTSDKIKLNGIADGAEVNVNADWTATTGDAQILNKPTLGSAAAAASSDFATAAQGTLADTSLQSVPVDYRGAYDNGDGTYSLDTVVVYNGQLYQKISNPGNPGYPPTGPDWQLFEPLIGSPAYDLFVPTQLNSKVDKVDGQGLSDENYTTADKNKLDAIVPSKLINGVNEVELGEDANLYLAQGGGIVFGQNNTSINSGQGGFRINSEQGISIEPVDQEDSENLITRGWLFSPNGSLIAPNNDYYYARSYIVLNNFPTEDSGFGLTTPDGVTHDFFYDYDGVVGAGTPILVNPLIDTITDVATKTITVLNDSALFGYIHWDAALNYIWVYQNVTGETGDQTNFNYGYADGVSPFTGGQSNSIVFGDGSIQTTAPTSPTYLLDRAHHTGNQSYTTITGLGSLATQNGTSSGTNTGDQTITLTGDVTGSGTGSFETTLKDTGPGVATYQSVTIDTKGRVTAGTNPTTLGGYGITDAVNAVATIVPISTSTAFASADNAKIFHVSGTTSLTLPSASSIPDGWSVGIVNVGGQAITITRTSSDTINGALTTFSNTVSYSAVYIYKSSATTFVAIGVLY